VSVSRPTARCRPGRDSRSSRGQVTLTRIDLNADVGEGFDEDAGLFGVVTSASVACGFHAGDDQTMRAACSSAVEHGVAIGAHVSFRDREGFGRRELIVPASVLRDEVAEQIHALQEHASAAGGRVAYVKPHGALYHRASVDVETASAIVAAVGRLPVLAFPRSQLIACARAAGLHAVPEAFADRAYTAAGALVARGEPGALLDADGAVRQALAIVRDGAVETRDGHRIDVDAASICLHSDTPGALVIARRVRDALEAAGIELRAFA
jgi:UPF0271 protein